MLRNGTLTELLRHRPQLKTLMLHNFDTLGPDVDPDLPGHHLESGAALSFEVITCRLEDRGGGLARVNGRPRLVEGHSMPREEAATGRQRMRNPCASGVDLAPGRKFHNPQQNPLA